MSTAAHNAEDQLALSAGLTAKTKQLCLGLESGAAEILELVTPTTAGLLAWWFGEDMVMKSPEDGEARMAAPKVARAEVE